MYMTLCLSEEDNITPWCHVSFVQTGLDVHDLRADHLLMDNHFPGSPWGRPSLPLSAIVRFWSSMSMRPCEMFPIHTARPAVLSWFRSRLGGHIITVRQVELVPFPSTTLSEPTPWFSGSSNSQTLSVRPTPAMFLRPHIWGCAAAVLMGTGHPTVSCEFLLRPPSATQRSFLHEEREGN